MPYGTLKVDTVTFTDNGADKSVEISGLVKNPVFSGDVTVTNVISGTTVRGSTVSGSTVTGETGQFQTATFTSGIFTTQISGATVTGDVGQFTTLNYVTGVVSDKFDVSGYYVTTAESVSDLTVTCTSGNYFIKTITGDSTFVFSGVPSSGSAYSFTLEVTHTSGTITWPSGVKWNGDVTPTLSTGTTHLFMFVTDDGGSRWRGAALVDYVN